MHLVCRITIYQNRIQRQHKRIQGLCTSKNQILYMINYLGHTLRTPPTCPYIHRYNPNEARGLQLQQVQMCIDMINVLEDCLGESTEAIHIIHIYIYDNN